MDISVIPKGQYCETFGAEAKTCPYWSEVKELPEQENGYCSYLEKSDFDINEETGELEVLYSKQTTPIKKVHAHEVSWSLLWDKCKMCGVNMEDPDEKSTEYYGYGEMTNNCDFHNDERQE
jgi:hypothetical protein